MIHAACKMYLTPEESYSPIQGASARYVLVEVTEVRVVQKRITEGIMHTVFQIII
jgi:hypothetical protein